MSHDPLDRPSSRMSAGGPLSSRQVWLIFAGLMVGNFLSALDTMVLVTALPTIVGDLGGRAQVAWVVTAYMLTSTTSAPIYGKLSDLYGRKRLYQGAIVIFVAGSAACGVAGSMGQLIAARALQGVGAGGLMVLSQAIIGDVVSPRERGRYQGAMGASMAVASLAGPLVGGFFVDHASWRATFFLNVPLGILALVVTGVVLKLPARARVRHRFDVVGTVLVVGAATAALLVATWGGERYAWTSPQIVGLGAAAVLATALLVGVERRAVEPVLPLRIFRSDVYAVALASTFILSAGMWAAWVSMPIFLQVVTGASASASGLLTFPLLCTMTITSILVGRAVSRTGRYRVFPIVGTALAVAAFALYATLDAGSTRLEASVFMVVLGLGLGMWMQLMTTIGQNAVAYRDLGVATSTMSLSRSLGGSVGATVALAVLNSRLVDALRERLTAGQRAGLGEAVLQGDPKAIAALEPGVRDDVVAAFADGLHAAFLLAVPLGVVALVVILFMRELPLRDEMPGAGDRGRDAPAYVPVADTT